jgi:hypothetical protein|tara:strand:- start:537 stop:725 length:189 start_codon:yes stop_codon:yes gene_type:complete
MTLKQAKKILDALGWMPGMGTRKLPPEERAEVKSALNVYASAGESYTGGKVKAKSKSPKAEV